MVPPEDLFGAIPIWIGVYVISALAFGLAGYIVYRRLFRLILLGKSADRLDQPVRRLFGALPFILGQRKVLQSVSIRRDRAGLFHFFIFWGFLSFTASYVLFIFLDSAWRPLSSKILSDTGVEVFVVYLNIVAVVFLGVLVWAAVRRWAVKPHRLSFDLTQKLESAIILVLVAMLMVLTLLTEAFFVTAGGEGPHAAAPISSFLGELFEDAGISTGVANGLQGLFWWMHLGIILGFGIYIPLSKHMHIIAAPLNFLTRSLEPMGTLTTPKDLETAEAFGASKIQDFSWKEMLDGYACAVCGRCTDVCPANISGKILSPMHIVEDLKDYVLEMGPGVIKGEDNQASSPLIGGAIKEEALWDCLTCGACVQVCPVGNEHVETIVD
ncbi:MAG: 4Fe-4S dicluster domain-containing protein, partial [Chloroflexi bacterium]|nr:4Fe-4S dicluster domain-containing protein [Chloroflexota bacterium]